MLFCTVNLTVYSIIVLLALPAKSMLSMLFSWNVYQQLNCSSLSPEFFHQEHGIKYLLFVIVGYPCFALKLGC